MMGMTFDASHTLPSVIPLHPTLAHVKIPKPFVANEHYQVIDTTSILVNNP
jgi:hypothetical protein